ncbi:hypothetical protein, partial [Desulfobacter curvatus]|uniref:hypothetical protein n=1 Tax=Desulfobacter curvatus TaxID=2290 RepID=UPI000684ABD1
MKRILYFLLGFSFVMFPVKYLYAFTQNGCTYPNVYYGSQAGFENYVYEGAKEAYIEMYPFITDVSLHLLDYSPYPNNSCVDVWLTYYSNGRYRTVKVAVQKCWVYQDGDPYGTSAENDTDNDGTPDNLDLKPNSPDEYKAAIVSVCYDENNKVVAGVIQDGEGNQYSFGTMPTDFEGYTIESVTGDLRTFQTAEGLAASLEKLDIDNLNITKQNNPVEIQDDGTIVPGSTDPFKDYRDAEDDQTEAKKPDTQQAPSEQPDSNDIDSDRLDKIIKNTSSTNTNLDNIQKYLGITNDYLAKINDKTGTASSTSSDGAVVTVTTPSADEIGQAVEDNLIDPGQTIDTTITDNIPDLDETDTLTAIKTKYSDRYDLFITTLKESDLFSLPFDI